MENVMIFVACFGAMGAGFGAGIKMGWDARRKSDEYDKMEACKEQAKKNRESFIESYLKCYEE